MRSPLNQRIQAYHKGQRAERIAAVYLWFKGYEILERRFKTPVGEIDLLVRKGKVLIAVEVKARASLEKAAFSIPPFQQKRIEQALLYYLARKPFPFTLRFDVILLAPWKWPFHIIGAWGR